MKNKFYILVDEYTEIGDIIDSSSKNNKGLLLRPTPIPFVNECSKYKIAEVTPIEINKPIEPNGILSGMYFAKSVIVNDVFNPEDIIERFDDVEILYNFIISTFNKQLKEKAFDKLYRVDNECNYLLKYIKEFGKNKAKILCKIILNDKKGDKLYRFGLLAKEYKGVVCVKLLELNNLELLVEYTRYVDVSTWKIQTILIHNNASPDLLYKFTEYNNGKEVNLELISEKIEELGGDDGRFMAKFGTIIEECKNSNKWWNIS